MKILGSLGPKRTKRIEAAALVAAGLMTIMLVAQLFGYDDFAVVLGALMPYSDNSSLLLTAALVVIAELLTLPYLLGMYLSPLMRVISGSLSACVATFWLFTCLTNSHASNSGLFSTTLELSGGLLATGWSLILFVCVVLVLKSDIRFANQHLEKKP